MAVIKKNKAISKIKREKGILEKAIISLFLVFVILVTVILFKAPEEATVPMTGKALSSIQLEKFQYNSSERLKGNISLQMDVGDILPGMTKIDVFISANAPNCSLSYICLDNSLVTWHNYTSGSCALVDSDPEGTCCLKAGANCKQVILNSKFNSQLYPGWFVLASGIDQSNAGIDSQVLNMTGDVVLDNALFLDSSSALQPNSNISVMQPLAQRAFKVKELVAPSKRVELQGDNVISCYMAQPPEQSDVPVPVCNNQVAYNATMFLYNQEAPTAQYTWSSSNDTIATLNATAGRFVMLSAHNPGWITIQVTATAGGEIATASKEICIYRDNPQIECIARQIETTYLSETKELKPELYFQTPPGSLRWKAAYTNIAFSGGCAFEIVVKGSNKALHYWYSLNPSTCSCPYGTSCKIKSPPIASEKVLQDSADVYTDWLSIGGNIEDTISEIWLVSYGKTDGYNFYGQRAYFDNVELRKYMATEPSTSCSRKGRCCGKGAGFGRFYGEQLTCPQDQECWENCTANVTLNLSAFISQSEIQKWNRTEGYCQAVVSGATIPLYDACYGSSAGYGACIDTSNNSCSTPLCKCRNWNNIYSLNLNKTIFTTFKAPAQNGTYALTVRIHYKPQQVPVNDTLIHEVSTPFYVGVSGAVECNDSFYNCINAPIILNWSTCINGTQTRVVNCTYTGTACPVNKAITQMQQCNVTNITLPCSEYDYSCDAWRPQPCRSMATQTRTCTLAGACDVNNPSSILPESQRTCDITAITEYAQVKYQEGMTKESLKQQLQQFGWTNEDIQTVINTVYGFEEKPSLGWLLYVGIGVVIVAIVVVVIIFVIVPSAKKGAGVKAKAEAYPELTSYIKDAQTTGATKQEISAKLQEAGWPKDAIEASFKAAQAQ